MPSVMMISPFCCFSVHVSGCLLPSFHLSSFRHGNGPSRCAFRFPPVLKTQRSDDCAPVTRISFRTRHLSVVHVIILDRPALPSVSADTTSPRGSAWPDRSALPLCQIGPALPCDSSGRIGPALGNAVRSARRRSARKRDTGRSVGFWILACFRLDCSVCCARA